MLKRIFDKIMQYDEDKRRMAKMLVGTIIDDHLWKSLPEGGCADSDVTVCSNEV